MSIHSFRSLSFFFFLLLHPLHPCIHFLLLPFHSPLLSLFLTFLFLPPFSHFSGPAPILPCLPLPSLNFVPFQLPVLLPCIPTTLSSFPLPSPPLPPPSFHSLPSLHSSPKAGEHGVGMQMVRRRGGVAGVVPAGCLLPRCQGLQLSVQLHQEGSAAGGSSHKESQHHAVCFVSVVGLFQL